MPGIIKEMNLGRETMKWVEDVGEEGEQEDRNTSVSISQVANHGTNTTS